MKKYLSIILIVSIAFPLTYSRLVTTYDPPSHYTFFREDVSGENPIEIEYDTDSSLSFAYEHSFVNKKLFQFYTGGEFMLSRSSSENISLHSVYIKPALLMTENILLFFKLGYCMLNKEDKGLQLKDGTMFSLGFEYEITERLSLGLSHSSYDLFEEKSVNPNNLPQHLNIQSSVSDTNIDLKYNKIGFSIIYGFNIE
tara:strand:- start:189 stop:782 length:594 start_codon:yes stop_codon:yes gene_type:complete